MTEKIGSSLDRRQFVRLGTAGVAALAVAGTGLAGCSKATTSEKSLSFKPGNYAGTGKGIHGDLQVWVQFSNDAIEKIVLGKTVDTLGQARQAVEVLGHNIVEGQTLNVDTVSGATMSSGGVLQAVKDAVTQAGGDVSALESRAKYPVAKPDDTRTMTADVVVCGSGLAGMAAGIAAAQAGAKVVMLEKEHVLGGSSALSAGGIAGTANPATAAAYAGELTSLAARFPAGKYPDASMVTALASKQAALHKWLSGLGFNLFDVSVQLGYPAGVMLAPFGYHGGDYIILSMADWFEKAGGVILRGTAATKLLKSGTGAIAGVEAKDANGKITVNAGNVVLATGGFARNKDMVKQYCPDQSDDITISAIGNTGDGILMAQDAGAAVFEQMHTMGCAGLWDPARTTFYSYISDPSVMGIYVGEDGKRRIAEDVGNYIVHAKFFGPGVDHYWAIFNADVLKAVDTAANPEASYAFVQGKAYQRVVDGVQKYPKKFFTADTIEGLAKACGIDAAGLKATFDKYNTMAAAGKDTEFNKKAKSLVAMNKGPFYAVYTQNYPIGTVGGVKTNIDAQVLDKSGNPIPGLFAAGEMSNRQFFNISYRGGYALSIDAAQGKTAGELAAKKK